MKAIINLIFCLLAASTFAQRLVVPLHENWEFQQEGKTIKYPATVPGTVHTDLMENKVIEDFYTEQNEEKYQWIGLENWVYSTTFSISPGDLSNKYIYLVFKGLDTYSEIEINGKKLGSTDNMFVEYRYNVSDYVLEGENRLKITFKSPINRNLKESQSTIYQLPSGNETGDTLVSSYTRKAAYHFGWDFAPRAITCGIWRAVYLELWNSVRVEDLKVTPHQLSDELAIMNLDVSLEGQAADGDSVWIECNNSRINVHPFQGSKNIQLKLNVNNPKLWYPNGYGEQEIYFDTLKIYKGTVVIDTHPFSYGIRQIDLHQIDDQHGKSFFFTVNGEMVFCKGANYVPQDMFLPSVTKQQTRDLLLNVKKANMNMIRVWGGGVYESDYFYSLCDSLGILVWQDFMFANSLYPNNPEFISSVRNEVEYNVKRLRNHPCIALWCGNNEVEVAWENWGWQKQYNIHGEDSISIWHNYQEMFHQLIPETLRRLDLGRYYIASSPISNWGNPKGLTEGCLHYWGVWHGKQPLESFKENVGRFVSEYGFPSYPSARTLKNYISFKNDSLNRTELSRRMKSYVGIEGISKEVDRYFGGTFNGYDFIDKSQAVQAYGQRIAIQSHRLKAPYCMGTLSWQLNDCWPGPSWSLIDHSGQPKAAYYETMTQYLPAMIAANVQNDTLILRGVSDLREKQEFLVELFFTDQNNENYEQMEYQITLKNSPTTGNNPHTIEIYLRL